MTSLWLNSYRHLPMCFALIALAIVTLNLGCELRSPQIEKDERLSVNDDNYDAIVQKSSKPVVMEFHADWCGPCRATEPAVAALSVEMPDIVFAKIDVDEATELAAKYQVDSIPCFIFFKDGQVVGRAVGSKSKGELESLVAEHLGEIKK